jgi:hypothetical protein
MAKKQAGKIAPKPKPKAKAKPPNPLSGGVPLRVDGSGIDGRVLGVLGSPFAISQGLNPNAIAAGANAVGRTTTENMMGTQAPTAKQLSDQQWNQVKRVAGAFQDSRFFKGARNQLNNAFNTAGRMENIGNQTISMGDAAGQQISGLAPLAQQQASFAANNIYGLAPQVTQIGDQYMGQVGGLGSMLADQSRNAFAQAGPTSIEQSLYDQGQAELALGRSLSPEEMRDATQSARQGMAARGMAMGNAALGAELLNRDRFANQRLAQRRAFAGEANNLREKNVMDRRKAAGDLAEGGGRMLDTAGRLGMAGREIAGRLFDAGGRINVLGTQTAGDLLAAGNQAAMQGRQVGGNLMEGSGRLRQTGASMAADLDPFARAMNAGLSLGQTAQSGATDMTGKNFGNMLELFGNAGSFNVNRADNFFNNYQNNAAAMTSGIWTGDSMRSAANAAKPKWWETGLGAVSNILG